MTWWMLEISIPHKNFKEVEGIVCSTKNSTTSDFIGELEDGVGGSDSDDPHILASQAEYEG
jgi:hypothetical protein